MSALPLEEGARYVAAAYVAFMVLVVLYVVIIAAKVSRMERELDGLEKPAEESRR
jgi:hypothetical protein